MQMQLKIVHNEEQNKKYTFYPDCKVGKNANKIKIFFADESMNQDYDFPLALKQIDDLQDCIDVQHVAYYKNHRYPAGRQLQNLNLIPKQCHHPNVVRIVDAFSDQSQGCKIYIIMERIKGQTLSKCDQLSNHEIFDVFTQIVKGVKFINQQYNLTHRDIKGENIMLEDGTSKPKLIDFGHSRYINPQENGSTRQTTTICMAPEFIKEQQNEDKRLDSWSLGILLFTMFKHSSYQKDIYPYPRKIVEYMCSNTENKNRNQIQKAQETLIRSIYQRPQNKSASEFWNKLQTFQTQQFWFQIFRRLLVYHQNRITPTQLDDYLSERKEQFNKLVASQRQEFSQNECIIQEYLNVLRKKNCILSSIGVFHFQQLSKIPKLKDSLKILSYFAEIIRLTKLYNYNHNIQVHKCGLKMGLSFKAKLNAMVLCEDKIIEFFKDKNFRKQIKQISLLISDNSKFLKLQQFQKSKYQSNPAKIALKLENWARDGTDRTLKEYLKMCYQLLEQQNLYQWIDQSRNSDHITSQWIDFNKILLIDQKINFTNFRVSKSKAEGRSFLDLPQSSWMFNNQKQEMQDENCLSRGKILNLIQQEHKRINNTYKQNSA